jgi:nitroreductase
MEEEKISKSDALAEVKKALRRAALIYHHFAETAVKELGKAKGLELVRKAVDAYGDQVGAEAKKKAHKKGESLTPENFESDLPDMAWNTEEVTVDGEQRVRVFHCPLAAEWLEWGNPEIARLYCFVDQAKMKGFNPDYEYVHIKNLLDGDAYCELAIRHASPEKLADEKTEATAASTKDTVWWVGGRYTEDDLIKMEPACLRALFRERVHHTIEVNLYPILLGKKKPPKDYGREPELILNIWRKIGLPEEGADIEWGKKYIALAKEIREGKKVKGSKSDIRPFAPREMETVKKLIWGRRSIRDWIPGKRIPDTFINQILEAGRAAPTACNLSATRFIVIRDPGEMKMVWSDIPTPADSCVMIVVCTDKRIFRTVGHDRLVGHNQLLDCAAAGDHMCLMAHALGLGGCWLTCTDETAERFRTKYGLPEYIQPILHFAVGWPATGTIKSGRVPLEQMIIKRRKSD